MSKKNFHGCYPTMITPYDDRNKIDYSAVKGLVDWYIKSGVDGIFAVCQSSEMFFLAEQEKIDLARAVLEFVDGRVKVVASGHTADDINQQIEQLGRMGELELDAVVMVSNRLAQQSEDEEVFTRNYEYVTNQLPDIRFGMYECPYPYLRLLSNDFISKVARDKKIFFLKDVSCRIDILEQRINIIKDSELSLFNANTATLLDSLKIGADGYSGVMANFHIDIYKWLYSNFLDYSELSQEVSDFLTVAAVSEVRAYPINAKFQKNLTGVPMKLHSRTRGPEWLNENARREVESLIRMEKRIREQLHI